ncbi:MAG: hypothetical protein D6734_02880 [Candidatus Schekmanbacteria bacterium]|nr:MAG: hypothetical protein D6734_02880 [Candidatus Schekmanbacteria bacterium]
MNDNFYVKNNKERKDSDDEKEEELYADKEEKNSLPPYMRISNVVTRILEKDEKVISAVSATRGVKLWEAIVTTCYAYTLKRVLLVFTDRRLIEISIGAGNLFASRIRVVQYSYIKDIVCTNSFLKKITVKCRDGISFSYEGIKKSDMDEISGELRNIIFRVPRSLDNPRLKNAVDLCPSCFEKLNILTYSCSSCGKKFKNEKNFLLYSLLIPGGAFIIAGFYFAAAISFTAEALFLIGFFSYITKVVVGSLRHLPFAFFYLFLFLISKFLSLKFCLSQIRSFIPSEQ